MLQDLWNPDRKRLRQSLLLLVIMLSSVLRFYDLGGDSIWSDEGLSIYRARQSIASNLTNEIIVQDVVTKDTQPPLYFVLLHLVRAVAGESEFALRFPSALFAVLIIPLLYVTGKRLVSAQVGLLAAVLGAASPTYLWYAQEMRMYTMLVFLSLLSVYALLRLFSEPVGWRRSKVLWLAGYLAASGAMIYTHYSGLFLLLFEAVVVAAFVVATRRWRMLAVMSIGALAVLPLLPFILQRLLTGAERDYSFVPLSIILYDLLNGLTVGIAVDLSRVILLQVVGGLVLLAGLLSPQREGLWGRWARAAFLAGYLLVPTLALYAASHIKPMWMGVRHLLVISPAAYLALGLGIAFLARKRTWPLGVLAALLLLGGNAYTTYNTLANPTYAKDDLRSMIYYVRDRFRAGDVVALNDAIIGNAFDYYAPDMAWTALPHYGQYAGAATVKEIQALRQRYDRIWYVFGPPSTQYDPEGFVHDWLEKNLLKLDHRGFHGHSVLLGVSCYATQSPLIASPDLIGLDTPQQADPETSLALLRYDPPAEPTPSGEALALDLYWWLFRPTEADYKVSVRLLGPTGEPWAQGDDEPFYFFPTSQWPASAVIHDVHEVLLPGGTPPGRYQVEIQVYHADTGETVAWRGPDGHLIAERAILGEVEIGPPKRAVVLSHLPPHRILRARFVPQSPDPSRLDLVAVSLASGGYAPGGVVHLDTYWRAASPLDCDLGVRAQLHAANGDAVLETSRPITLGAYPTSQWRAGDIVRGQMDLLLPETLGAGSYTIHLQLYDLATGQAASVRRGILPWPQRWLRLGDVSVEEPERPTTVKSARPAIQYPLEASLGEQIALLGYDLAEGTVSAGGALSLTLYWQCTGPVSASYSVFTHVIDASDAIWGQKDGVPAAGTRPTSGWATGEIIQDAYEIPIKPDTPAGEYLLEVGMYTSAGRLAAFDAAGARLPLDRIILGSIQVTPAGDSTP